MNMRLCSLLDLSLYCFTIFLTRGPHTGGIIYILAIITNAYVLTVI